MLCSTKAQRLAYADQLLASYIQHERLARMHERRAYILTGALAALAILALPAACLIASILPA